MTIKQMQEVRAQQKEVVIDTAPEGISEEILEKEQTLLASLERQIQHLTEDYAMRMAGSIERAEPTLPTYMYWDVFSYGPVQYLGYPPYIPSKIVAAGETCYIYGLIWINPVNGPGGGLPGSIVLGDRNYTMCFETTNLSQLALGPEFSQTDTFPSPAPLLTWVRWEFVAPDPGPQPKLYEVNLTVDVNVPGQPFAAFSTWHLDKEGDTPFDPSPGLPPLSHHPLRFMVYRK